jgi:predicted DNA-binding protein YlxM (UPF0122 family)
MKTRKSENVDMHRYPFRGIYSEIAREEGVTRQAIQQAARKGSPKILQRIAEKVEERKAMLKKYSKVRTSNKSAKAGKQGVGIADTTDSLSEK